MFDSICVRRQRTLYPSPLDAGLLAELLLFCGRVRVVADIGLLNDLAAKCGPPELVELVTSGRLAITYLPSSLTILTENTGSPNELHRATAFSIPGKSEMQHALPAAFQQAVGKSGRARRMAAKVLPHVQEFAFNDELTESAEQDFVDSAHMSGAARALLREIAPEYDPPETIRFEADHRASF